MKRTLSAALAPLTFAALTFAALTFTAAPALAGPPGGVPPGLAKKGVSAHEWQAHKRGHDWRAGDQLPRSGWVVINDYDRYDLPHPGAGYSYYVVDGEVLRVVDATLKVAAAVGAVSTLLN